MRIVIALVLALISLSLLSPEPISQALAQDSCRCKGCGCKGGPGWRGPDGSCVPQGKLADICGSPPGVPCKQEGALRVCFGKEAARAEPGQQAAP